MSTVKIRRSGTASSTPSSLDHGELAINYADAKLFWKDATNTIKSFVFQAYASATHTHVMANISDVSIASAGSPAVAYDVALTYNYATSTWEAKAGGNVGVGPAPLAGWPTGSIGKALEDLNFGKRSLTDGTFSDRISVSSAAGSTTPTFRVINTGTGNSVEVWDEAGDETIFSIDASGNVGVKLIYTQAPSEALHVVGNGLFTGTVTADGQLLVKTNDARLTDARSPTAHASTHATGGSDALTPSDIGAAPAASPAITGNATFEASSGVPVTITNTGTGNSFVVNDAAGDTSPFVVNASGAVGIGISAPNAPLNVIAESSSTGAKLQTWAYTAAGNENFNLRLTQAVTAGIVQWVFNQTNNAVDYPSVMCFDRGNVGINKTSPTSRLDVNGVITVAATSGSAGSYAPSLTISGDSNTGFGQVSGQSDTASIFTAGHERVRVDSSGRVGINTASANASVHIKASAAQSRGIIVERDSAEAAGIDYNTTGGFVAGVYGQNGGGLRLFVADGAGGTVSEAIRVTSLSRVGIGTTSPTGLLDINADTMRLRTARTPASATAAGNAGDICWDASYLYICTATNTWRRIAHSTW